MHCLGCTAPWVHVCLSMGVYAVCVNISVNTYYYFFFLFFFFLTASGIVDCLTVRDGVWCQSAVQNTKRSMGQCLNVSMFRVFFGFVCLFLTIVGFLLKFVLFYQMMRSPPGLFFGILWKGAVGFPLQVADTTNTIQTGNSYQRKCYLGFFKLLLFKEGNKKLSCCFLSFFRIQFVFFNFTHHHTSLNHPPSDQWTKLLYNAALANTPEPQCGFLWCS